MKCPQCGHDTFSPYWIDDKDYGKPDGFSCSNCKYDNMLWKSLIEFTDARDNENFILNNICAERTRQQTKWGLQSHSIPIWMMILGEEYGEACLAANKYCFENMPIEELRKELLHTIAVALAIIESLGG